jgi:hypothetical protein
MKRRKKVTGAVMASTPKTTHIRVRADLATMIGEISRQTGEKSPEIADRILRPVLTKQFTALLPALEQMAKSNKDVRDRLASLKAMLAASAPVEE